MAYEFYITPDEYEIAEQYGIDRNRVDIRIREWGWPKEKAITTPVRKTTDRRDWAKIAEENGICYPTFMGRVNALGWSEERAATQPLQDRREIQKKATDAVRKIPVELMSLATSNGIARGTLRARLKKGMDPQEAATKPPMDPKVSGRMGAKKVKELYGDINRFSFGGGEHAL